MDAITKARIGPRLYATAVLGVLLGVTAAWAQDQAAENPAEVEEQPEAATTGSEAENDAETASDGTAADGTAKAPGDEEKSILDDQTYEGEDEDFIPTEEIPLDKPIPFPTDI